MANRKAIKSVLRNFLGTYTSRYTDYHGYWLFGFLVADLGELEFDLLGPKGSDLETPLVASKQLAAIKFEDQLRKAGLEPSHVRDARLRIRRSPGAAECSINGQLRDGYNVTFQVGAVMDDGRAYECEQLAIVAPHDPLIELRSAPYPAIRLQSPS